MSYTRSAASFHHARNGNFSELQLFHFFYGWNSGAGKEITDIFAMQTYSEFPDLFEARPGPSILTSPLPTSQVFYGSHSADFELTTRALMASLQQQPESLRLCRKLMTATDLNLGILADRRLDGMLQDPDAPADTVWISEQEIRGE